MVFFKNNLSTVLRGYLLLPAGDVPSLLTLVVRGFSGWPMVCTQKLSPPTSSRSIGSGSPTLANHPAIILSETLISLIFKL